MAILYRPRTLSTMRLSDHAIALEKRWWAQAYTFEEAIEYNQATEESRLAWDAIAERQFPHWPEAFCDELELTISIWRKRYPAPASPKPFLDALCWTGSSFDLALPHYALLAIFRLRCSLMGAC